MTTVIPQKELRNHVSAVLRRVEAGEVLTVTVAGRAVAELRPVRRQQWVGGPALANIWRSPRPLGVDDDLARLDAAIVDPFE